MLRRAGGGRSHLDGAGDSAEFPPAQPLAQQAVDEILEAHFFIRVVADGELLAGGINRARRIEAHREGEVFICAAARLTTTIGRVKAVRWEIRLADPEHGESVSVSTA